MGRRGPKKVMTAMAPTFTPDDDRATIAAEALKTLDRKSYYHPRKVSLETLPSMTSVAT